MSATNTTRVWNNLNSSTFRNFDRTIRDTIFNKHILLGKLYEKKKDYDGGHEITEPIMYDRGQGQSYSGFDVFTPSDKEIVTTSLYTPAHYVVDISVAYTDDLANRGKSAIFDLIEAKYTNAKMTMEYLLTVDLYRDGTTGTAPIVGLDAAIAEDPTTGTYGNINRATNSYWRNQLNDQSTSGLAGLTMYKLQTLWGACSDGTIHPDMIITTQAIYDKVWSIADARQRLGNEEAAKLGYTSIDFNGVPLVVDKHCTAGSLFMINTDFLHLKVHKDDDMQPTPFLQGTTQLVKVKYITWTGQLVSSNPRYQGVMFDLV